MIISAYGTGVQTPGASLPSQRELDISPRLFIPCGLLWYTISMLTLGAVTAICVQGTVLGGPGCVRNEKNNATSSLVGGTESNTHTRHVQLLSRSTTYHAKTYVRDGGDECHHSGLDQGASVLRDSNEKSAAATPTRHRGNRGTRILRSRDSTSYSRSCDVSTHPRRATRRC